MKLVPFIMGQGGKQVFINVDAIKWLGNNPADAETTVIHFEKENGILVKGNMTVVAEKLST